MGNTTSLVTLNVTILDEVDSFAEPSQQFSQIQLIANTAPDPLEQFYGMQAVYNLNLSSQTSVSLAATPLTVLSSLQFNTITYTARGTQKTGQVITSQVGITVIPNSTWELVGVFSQGRLVGLSLINISSSVGPDPPLVPPIDTGTFVSVTFVNKTGIDFALVIFFDIVLAGSGQGANSGINNILPAQFGEVVMGSPATTAIAGFSASGGINALAVAKRLLGRTKNPCAALRGAASTQNKTFTRTAQIGHVVRLAAILLPTDPCFPLRSVTNIEPVTVPPGGGSFDVYISPKSTFLTLVPSGTPDPFVSLA